MSWSLTGEELLHAVRMAGRAPSVHNSQPWRFRLDGPALDVLLDPARLLPVADPDGWAARVSCGAAAENLRLALAVRGTPAAVTTYPKPADDLLLVRLTPASPKRPPTPVERRLYEAIPRRHTNRHPFTVADVPKGLAGDLLAAARDAGAWLAVIDDAATVDAAGSLTREADELLRADSEYRDELRSWTRMDDGAGDGVAVAAGGPAPRPYDLLVRRDFGGQAATLPHPESAREPMLAVLGTHGESRHDDVRAGMALERVLLTATDLGLSSALFSQPIEVPAVRARLGALVRRSGRVHMLIRFGYAARLAVSERRQPAELIVPVAPPL